MKKYLFINLDTAGRWGIAVNHGTPENPALTLICTATEAYARLLTDKLNTHRIEIDPPAPPPDTLSPLAF